MKKLFTLFLIVSLALSAAACKKPPETEPQTETPPPASAPEVKDNVDFRNEAEEMTRETAEAYLEKEDVDKTSVQYKEAVCTVNESLAAQYIADSKNNKAPTAKTQELFDGIFFRFVEGEGFKSQTVKLGLQAMGTYEKEEDGWYRFVFFDRRLAQGSINQDGDYCLNEYKKALEFLLSDPNVIVKPINE